MATTCGLVMACGLIPAALALAPRPGEPVVALTLFPDAPMPHAVAASGARLLWLLPGGHVAVLAGDTPDLAANLRRSGTLLVLAAGPLGACLPGTRPTPMLTGPSQP